MSRAERIPIADPAAEHRELAVEIDAAVKRLAEPSVRRVCEAIRSCE